MILAVSILGGLFWFAFIYFILYARQRPESQIRRRLNILIERAELERLNQAKYQHKQQQKKLQDAAKNAQEVNAIFLDKNSFAKRVINPIFKKIDEKFQNLAPSKLRSMFEIRIFRAGKQGVWSIKRLITVWLISLVAGVLVAFFITKNWNFHFLQQIVIIASGAAGGSALPFLILNSQIEKRQKHLKRQLPEFLDLLCVSVQAGLSFDGAVSKINARMKGALIDEFKRVQSDVSLGMTRQYALTQMAKRCDLEEIYLFTSSVIQAEKLGTSMSKTLKMQADNMRDRHRQYVKAEAMKAPVKIIFPMVLFIFPSIFVVLLFPAILTLMKALGN